MAAKLKDRDYSVRWKAADALGKIGGQGRSSLPEVAALLKDSDSSVRWKAADALGKMGEAGARAAALLKDSDSGTLEGCGHLRQDGDTGARAACLKTIENSSVRWKAADA